MSDASRETRIVEAGYLGVGEDMRDVPDTDDLYEALINPHGNMNAKGASPAGGGMMMPPMGMMGGGGGGGAGGGAGGGLGGTAAAGVGAPAEGGPASLSGLGSGGEAVDPEEPDAGDGSDTGADMGGDYFGEGEPLDGGGDFGGGDFGGGDMGGDVGTDDPFGDGADLPSEGDFPEDEGVEDEDLEDGRSDDAPVFEGEPVDPDPRYGPPPPVAHDPGTLTGEAKTWEEVAAAWPPVASTLSITAVQQPGEFGLVADLEDSFGKARTWLEQRAKEAGEESSAMVDALAAAQKLWQHTEEENVRQAREIETEVDHV